MFLLLRHQHYLNRPRYTLYRQRPKKTLEFKLPPELSTKSRNTGKQPAWLCLFYQAWTDTTYEYISIIIGGLLYSIHLTQEKNLASSVTHADCPPTCPSVFFFFSVTQTNPQNPVSNLRSRSSSSFTLKLGRPTLPHIKLPTVSIGLLNLTFYFCWSHTNTAGC